MRIENKYQKTVIYKYSLDGVYISSYSTCVEAGKENYLYHRVIEKCCRGQLKTAGGFQWRRVVPSTPTENIAKVEPNPASKCLPTKVDQYDENGKYIKTHPSIKSAAREVHTDPKNIREVLKGNQRKAGGFIWKKA